MTRREGIEPRSAYGNLTSALRGRLRAHIDRGEPEVTWGEYMETVEHDLDSYTPEFRDWVRRRRS